MRSRYPYLPKGVFIQPQENEEIDLPYVMDSRLLQDLEQRNREAVFVTTLNLSTAGEMLISQPGFHFCIYGHDGTSIKTVDTTAYVGVFINKQNIDGSNPFPAKHARGFSGPFSKLYLQWPAQNNVYCDLVIYKGSQKPWIDGESCT